MSVCTIYGTLAENGFNKEFTPDSLKTLSNALHEHFGRPTHTKCTRRVSGNTIIERTKETITFKEQGRILSTDLDNHRIVIRRKPAVDISNLGEINCNFLCSGWDARITSDRYSGANGAVVIIERMQQKQSTVCNVVQVGSNDSLTSLIMSALFVVPTALYPAPPPPAPSEPEAESTDILYDINT